MNFRSDGVSEDCLYLNVWTPAKNGGSRNDGSRNSGSPSGDERLPVLVYFYGGGFIAGDGSEYRYDGESMARQGIVTVTVNYRLNVFGFLAHPELTQASPQQASGNYGLLDQAAALQWVHDNIAAFGGDPDRITIAGESAGSFSVSAQMASPLSRELIAGAIWGEWLAAGQSTAESTGRGRAKRSEVCAIGRRCFAGGPTRHVGRGVTGGNGAPGRSAVCCGNRRLLSAPVAPGYLCGGRASRRAAAAAGLELRREQLPRVARRKRAHSAKLRRHREGALLVTRRRTSSGSTPAPRRKK